jgi:hypothetical protein
VGALIITNPKGIAALYVDINATFKGVNGVFSALKQA